MIHMSILFIIRHHEDKRFVVYPTSLSVNKKSRSENLTVRGSPPRDLSGTFPEVVHQQWAVNYYRMASVDKLYDIAKGVKGKESLSFP